MSDRWLRNIVDGSIYGWNEILADNPKCEEVTEEQAFPERFVKPESKRITAARKRNKIPLDLSDIAEEPPANSISPDLSQDASKGLPK